MPKMHLLMKLSREEEIFLSHWMHDEVHYRDGPGLAKQLQLHHRAIPADLATLIAAAWPDPADQAAAAESPPSETPRWPWPSADALHARVVEARAVLGSKCEGTAERNAG